MRHPKREFGSACRDGCCLVGNGCADLHLARIDEPGVVALDGYAACCLAIGGKLDTAARRGAASGYQCAGKAAVCEVIKISITHLVGGGVDAEGSGASAGFDKAVAGEVGQGCQRLTGIDGDGVCGACQAGAEGKRHLVGGGCGEGSGAEAAASGRGQTGGGDTTGQRAAGQGASGSGDGDVCRAVKARAVDRACGLQSRRRACIAGDRGLIPCIRAAVATACQRRGFSDGERLGRCLSHVGELIERARNQGITTAANRREIVVGGTGIDAKKFATIAHHRRQQGDARIGRSCGPCATVCHGQCAGDFRRQINAASEHGVGHCPGSDGGGDGSGCGGHVSG